MPYQTTVQKADAIRIGSAKIKVGDSTDALVDLGAVRNVVSQESWELVKVMGDNVGEIKKFIKNHINTITFNWLELDLANLNSIRGGLDDYSVVNGDPVTVEAEAHGTGWTVGKPFRLNYKNGDDTVVASITVKAGESELIVDDDYKVFVGDGAVGTLGYTYITPLTAQTGAITVDYTYTPNASKVLKTGGKVSIDPKVVRLTNVNEDGKKFQVTVYKATNSSGINLTLPADDADDIWLTPVTLEGVCDASRPTGDQLMEIIDEQSIA